MSSTQRTLTLTLILGTLSLLTAQASASAVAMPNILKRDGGASLTPDTTYATCGETTCAEATCIVKVNAYGCDGEYNGAEANGQVAGTCDNLVKGGGGSIPMSCDGVSLLFCQVDGTNYVDFRNAEGPSSGVCTMDSTTGGYDCGPFDTGSSMCGS